MSEIKIPSMGNTLRHEIQRYLRECNEVEAADFLNDCEVENYYKDSVSGVDDDYERDLYEITVFVPVKKFRSLGSETEKIQNTIHDAISEYAYSSGRLIYKIDWQPFLQKEEELKLDAKAIDVVNLLGNSQYVNSKLQILRDTIDKTPHLAIGTSKELIEVCCKGILLHYQISIDPNWELQRLVKETNKVLDFSNGIADDKFKQSINLITGGLANIIHGVAEIRNKFGSGHGHGLDFQELDKAYTHLVVYCAFEFVIFYQRIFKAQKV